MIDFSRKIFIPFEHIDLFFYRETNQNNFKSKIFYPDKNLNHFGRQQIKISFAAIKSINPRVIIINNALSSDIFKKVFDKQLFFNKARGWHEIKINGEKVPIFFSSMLGGQRPLDNHSWERLKWHIMKALHLRSGLFEAMNKYS